MFAMIVGIIAVVYVGAALLSVLGLIFGTLFSAAFSLVGWVFSGKGIILGIIIGLALCWAQQTFGLVKLGSSSGSFIIDSYPVSVHPEDINLIFLTVLIVGFLAVWYPVRYFSRRLLA